jgi:hypothetical protein
MRKGLKRDGQREAVQWVEEEVVDLVGRWNEAMDRRVRAVRWMLRAVSL